eukprot:gene1440-12228_t
MPWTELHVAAEAGSDADARAAIEAGVDVNSVDDGEQSALHRACGFGRHTTAEILLDAGADIDARDDSGSTPLHLAAWKGQVPTVEVLVSARADLNAKGLYGDTPLHLAASYGQTGVAEVLANANADVNAKDHANKTPLDWAKESNQSSSIAMLLRVGGSSTTWQPAVKQDEGGGGVPAQREILSKIIVVGDTGTGKTSFIKRATQGVFSSQYKATIGVDFALKMVALDDYTTEAVGAFIVFDLSRRPTFESVAKWRHDIAEKVTLPEGKAIPVVLLANKCDLKDESESGIQEPEIRQFVRDLEIDAFFYTSSKEDTGLDDAIGELVTKIMETEHVSYADLDPSRFKVKRVEEDETTCCNFN